MTITELAWGSYGIALADDDTIAVKALVSVRNRIHEAYPHVETHLRATPVVVTIDEPIGDNPRTFVGDGVPFLELTGINDAQAAEAYALAERMLGRPCTLLKDLEAP